MRGQHVLSVLHDVALDVVWRVAGYVGASSPVDDLADVPLHGPDVWWCVQVTADVGECSEVGLQDVSLLEVCS